MFRSFRVALTATACLTLLAAAEAPQTTQTIVQDEHIQLASLASPPTSSFDVAPLAATFEADDTLTVPETSSAARSGSLRELVSAITALPSIELSKDMHCLAIAVYFESKGEPLEGQLAVAQVVLNRVASGRWANNVCGVVHQRGQFSFIGDRHPDTPAEGPVWRTAQAIAVIAATNNWRDIVPNATYFHATRVAPGWRGLERIAAVGNHVFYRQR